jgi:hypothetical protein
VHRMLLLFSHKLTEDQKEDANTALGVREFLALPDNLQQLWMNIPPAMSLLSEYLEPIRSWINKNLYHGDYVLIQGDYGAVYLMVNYAFSVGLIPVYATTERMVVEKLMPDGVVKSERVFKHKMFRRYEGSGA